MKPGRGVLVLALLMALTALIVGIPSLHADSLTSTVSVGSSPREVAITPDGNKAYISNRLSNDLSVIDTSTDSVVATVPAGLGPGAIHIGHDGRVYVPDREGNTLTVIDSSTESVISTIAVGLRPSAVDATRDNSRVVVTNERAGSVTIIDGSTLTEIATLDTGRAPHTVVVSPDGAKAYVADEVANNVTVIDIASATPGVLATIPVGLGPGSMQFVGTGSSALFVANRGSGTVSIIDTGSDTVTNTVRVGDAPHGLVETPHTSHVFVANEASGTVTALAPDGRVLATIPVQANPQRIHVTADGARAYVPNEGSDSVSVIDVNEMRVIQTVAVGSAPASLRILSSSKVYVANLRSNTVSVIDVEPQGTAPGEATSTTSQGATTDGAPTGRGTPLAGVAGTATAARGTASAVPSATKAATTRIGGGRLGANPPPALGSPEGGGAPSWIWLAVVLGVVTAAAGGGYLGRGRIVPGVSRLIRQFNVIWNR